MLPEEKAKGGGHTMLKLEIGLQVTGALWPLYHQSNPCKRTHVSLHLSELHEATRDAWTGCNRGWILRNGKAQEGRLLTQKLSSLPSFLHHPGHDEVNMWEAKCGGGGWEGGGWGTLSGSWMPVSGDIPARRWGVGECFIKRWICSR